MPSKNRKIKFNVNNYVYVKLNPEGEKILKDNYHKLGLDRVEPYYPKKKDKKGYSEFQLWDLMMEFGEHIYHGCKMPFECNILMDRDNG